MKDVRCSPDNDRMDHTGLKPHGQRSTAGTPATSERDTSIGDVRQTSPDRPMANEPNADAGHDGLVRVMTDWEHWISLTASSVLTESFALQPLRRKDAHPFHRGRARRDGRELRGKDPRLTSAAAEWRLCGHTTSWM